MNLKLILIATVSLFTVSCMADLKKAKLVQQYGRDAIISEIFFVQEFMTIISPSRITISAFIDDDPLHRKAQLSGYINERFHVLVNFDVRFSASNQLSVDNYSQPKVSIHEISNISQSEDGRYRLRFSKNYKIDESLIVSFLSKKITIDELLRDFMNDDQGIAGFHEYIEWRDTREE
jgi:hypothetical protein